MNRKELESLASGGAAPADVEAYATANELTFPADYFEFLVDHGGFDFPGPPYTWADMNGEGSLLQSLASFDEVYTFATAGESDGDDDDATYVYKFDHCVIGRDLSGDEMILITAPGAHANAVYGWEHESEAGFLEAPWEDVQEQLDALETGGEQIELLISMRAMVRLADSFSGFIESVARKG